MPIIRRKPVSEANETEISSRKINKQLDILDKKMDSLYRDIYITRTDNRKNMNTVIDNLDDAIDKLQLTDTNNVSGMSELLRRVTKRDNTNVTRLMGSVEELFSDEQLIRSLFQNDEIHKYIAGQNYQYDMICRYIPKLVDALEIKRDNVLCSENLSKEYINPTSVRSSKAETEKFNVNSDQLITKYELSEFFDKTYMNTSKYGEDFIYVVPYTVAFERLLKRLKYRRSNSRLGSFSIYESSEDFINSGNNKLTILRENYVESPEFKTYMDTVRETIGTTDNKFMGKFEGAELNLHFNDSGVVINPVNEITVLKDKQKLDMAQSLFSVFESGVMNEKSLQDEYEKIKSDNDGISSAMMNDGLFIPGELIDRDPDKISKNINGAVLERLRRENVVPVYIGKKCLGYYYFEFREDPNACGYCGGNHITPTVNSSSAYGYQLSEEQQEVAIRFIASRISAGIDSHFINANKDLKEEIYQILRYNDQFDMARSNDIGVTFIPAEDIVHCYFEFDEDTHRGISDLHKSVVPAMLYVLLYLTDIIGKITRSTDKRIYYVKQNVETNVARTMMNVVAQIKKGNMGMRQIESMNNILNIVGKYNDYIIPMGQSGDPPIQFEVMNGQNIETPSDIMEKMEEAAVNSTGVPIEFVNSTYQQDFAIRYSMTNTRFLRTLYTRQRKTQVFFSKIYTKLYNYEYNENYSKIEIILPPPTYLTMNNNQQLLDNISGFADKLVETELASEEDDVKNEFKKLYIRNSLSSYIDYEMVERLIQNAKVNIETRKPPAVQDGENSGDDSGSDF